MKLGLVRWTDSSHAFKPMTNRSIALLTSSLLEKDLYVIIKKHWGPWDGLDSSRPARTSSHNYNKWVRYTRVDVVSNDLYDIIMRLGFDQMDLTRHGLRVHAFKSVTSGWKPCLRLVYRTNKTARPDLLSWLLRLRRARPLFVVIPVDVQTDLAWVAHRPAGWCLLYADMIYLVFAEELKNSPGEIGVDVIGGVGGIAGNSSCRCVGQQRN